MEEKTKYRISIDWVGAYLPYKEFFDAMAIGLQAVGHEVGIVTGERESRRAEIEASLGFKPDFMLLWGEYETIGSGGEWKARQLNNHEILVHFDDDATQLKLWSDRWIFKTMDPDRKELF